MPPLRRIFFTALTFLSLLLCVVAASAWMLSICGWVYNTSYREWEVQTDAGEVSYSSKIMVIGENGALQIRVMKGFIRNPEPLGHRYYQWFGVYSDLNFPWSFYPETPWTTMGFIHAHREIGTPYSQRHSSLTVLGTPFFVPTFLLILLPLHALNRLVVAKRIGCA
jgi:hypothetical protein